MKIVTPYARIDPDMRLDTRDDGILLLRRVERYGRKSHRSEERQEEYTWETFIKSVVLNHGDWSITEHIHVTVEAEVDRGITHEWVRHRLGNYTQESTRFVNYSKPDHEPRFIKPADLFGSNETMAWEASINQAEKSYRHLLSLGKPPQIARSILPNCLATEIVVTYNLRGWRHFFLMRTSKEAHPQMREVTIPLLWEFQEKIPLLYDDIQPGMRQADALRLPR